MDELIVRIYAISIGVALLTLFNLVMLVKIGKALKVDRKD